MKLATFRAPSGDIHLGAALDTVVGLRLLSISAAARALKVEPVPVDMFALVTGGPSALAIVSDIVVAAERDLDAVLQCVFDPDHATFLPPLPNPGKIISVGANYPSHVEDIDAAQSDADVSEIGRNLASGEYPPAFSKLPSSLTGHNGPIPYPSFTSQLDYEAELALVLGDDPARHPADQWQRAIFGYMISNDVSAREVQFREMKRGLILMGKNFEGALPTGPWIVTADEVGDPHDITITTWVNGQRRQHDNTRRMIFSIPQILEYYRPLPFRAGDVITTGSPAGVAIGMPDAASYFLRRGDRIEIQMSRLGTLRNDVV